ncbi:hypothetical protein LINPERHAP1_LOCUS20917, partial [Linum perenne]
MAKLGARRKLRPKMEDSTAAAVTPLQSVIAKKKTRTERTRRGRSSISPIMFASSNPAATPLFTPTISSYEVSYCGTTDNAVAAATVTAGGHDGGVELSPESRKRKLAESEPAEERHEYSPGGRMIIKRYYSKRRKSAR